MAESSYCASKFTCPSIAEFLDRTDMFENTADDELEEFSPVPLEVLQSDAAPPTFNPLQAPPSAYLVVLATPTSYSA